MSILKTLSTNLSTYPIIYKSELLAIQPPDTQKEAFATVSAALENIPNEPIHIYTLVNQLVTKAKFPPEVRLNIYLEILEEGLVFEKHPLDLFASLQTPEPIPFAAFILYLIKHKVSAQAIINAHMLLSFFSICIVKIEKMEQAYQLLSQTTDLPPEQQDELQDLLHHANTTNGCENYALNGRYFKGTIQSPPLIERELTYTANLDNLNQIALLFELNLDEQKNIQNKFETLKKTYLIRGLPFLMSCSRNYFSQKEVHYWYFLTEKVPQLSNSELERFIDYHCENACLKLPAILSLLTPDQIYFLIFKKGSPWVAIDRLNGIEHYFSQRVNDRLLQESIKAVDLKLMCECLLKEPLVPLQRPLGVRTMQFLVKQHYTVSSYDLRAISQSLQRFNGVTRWCATYTTQLRNFLMWRINRHSLINKKSLAIFLRCYEEEQEKLTLLRRVSTSRINYPASTKELKALVLLAHFRKLPLHRILSALTPNQEEAQEILCIALAMSQDSRVQQTLIQYLQTNFPQFDWKMATIDGVIMTALAVFFQNTWLLKNHLLQTLPKDKCRQVLIKIQSLQLNCAYEVMKGHFLELFLGASNDILMDLFTLYTKEQLFQCIIRNQAFFLNRVALLELPQTLKYVLNVIPEDRRLFYVQQKFPINERSYSVIEAAAGGAHTSRSLEALLATLPEADRFSSFKFIHSIATWKLSLQDFSSPFRYKSYELINLDVLADDDLNLKVIETCFSFPIIPLLHQVLQVFIQQKNAADDGSRPYFLKPPESHPASFIEELFKCKTVVATLQFLSTFLSNPYPFHDFKDQLLLAFVAKEKFPQATNYPKRLEVFIQQCTSCPGFEAPELEVSSSCTIL